MKMPKQRLAELQADPNDRRHGTKTGVNLGCKCEACCDARKAINAERRARQARERMGAEPKKRKSYEERRAELLMDPNDRRHGTKSGANLRCPCPRCREAAVKAMDELSERKREKVRAKPEAPRPRPRPKQGPSKDVCTVPEFLKPLMGKPSIDNAEGRCCWCGAPNATNRHHIVKRSQGKWVKDGREVSKPTVRLCGDGNASGCHGKAHSGKLHFRWVDPKPSRFTDEWSRSPLGSGHWEARESDEPCDVMAAWGEKDGWRKI